MIEHGEKEQQDDLQGSDATSDATWMDFYEDSSSSLSRFDSKLISWFLPVENNNQTDDEREKQDDKNESELEKRDRLFLLSVDASFIDCSKLNNRKQKFQVPQNPTSEMHRYNLPWSRVLVICLFSFASFAILGFGCWLEFSIPLLSGHWICFFAFIFGIFSICRTNTKTSPKQLQDHNCLNGRLYIGSRSAALSREFFATKGIGVIVNCAQELSNPFRNVMLYKHIKLEDDVEQDLFEEIPEAVKYIDDQLKKTNVLVHCQMGMSRSAAIVVAYLLFKFEFSSVQAAIDYLKVQRYVVRPNKGFIHQLERYFNTLHS